MTDVKQKRTYRKRVRKTPRIGTVEWELWRLQDGETYTIARFLHIDEATMDKLRKLKMSARSQLGNYFKKLRLEHGKEFTLSVYDLYDNNRKCHVVFAVATAIDPSRLEKVEGDESEYSDL